MHECSSSELRMKNIWCTQVCWNIVAPICKFGEEVRHFVGHCDAREGRWELAPTLACRESKREYVYLLHICWSTWTKYANLGVATPMLKFIAKILNIDIHLGFEFNGTQHGIQILDFDSNPQSIWFNGHFIIELKNRWFGVVFKPMWFEWKFKIKYAQQNCCAWNFIKFEPL